MTPDGPPEDLLRPYVTSLDRPVFALRNLPEEVVAVLFAYYSRSPHSLRENLGKLIREGDLDVRPELAAVGGEAEWVDEARERARQFHEKWVVGYGHSSVAEHAVVHLAVERISIVASKAVEDCRLASYTEKSTRYVAFDTDSYVREPEICASPDAALYDHTCSALLEAYATLLPQLEQQIAADLAVPPGWSERRRDSVCRAKACDLARYLLPAATRTNLGLTVNGRALEHLLTKLYSAPLAELRELAQMMREEAQALVPTLIKYAAPNDYLKAAAASAHGLAAELLDDAPAPTAEGNVARLVSAPSDPLTDLATAILFEHGRAGHEAVRGRVARLSEEDKRRVIDGYLADRGPHDEPRRALEHLVYTFELLVDYGAYRDIQRHRMCTQTDQVLDCADGYETPPELDELGRGEGFRAAVEQAAEAHAVLAGRHGPERAQYVVPLAFRKRLLITWNLRELHHFISLRSGKQGHASYRRIAQQCWHELHRVHPELARHVRVDLETYDLARA